METVCVMTHTCGSEQRSFREFIPAEAVTSFRSCLFRLKRSGGMASLKLFSHFPHPSQQVKPKTLQTTVQVIYMQSGKMWI